MRIMLLVLSLLFTSPSWALICMGTPKDVPFRTMERTTHVLPANGIVRIESGTEQPEIVEVYRNRGEPFTDLNFTIDVNRDSDSRNSIVKWLWPKELKPNTYAINLFLEDERIKQILGANNAEIRINVRIRIKQEIKTIDLVFNSNLSYNCQPR